MYFSEIVTFLSIEKSWAQVVSQQDDKCSSADIFIDLPSIEQCSLLPNVVVSLALANDTKTRKNKDSKNFMAELYHKKNSLQVIWQMRKNRNS